MNPKEFDSYAAMVRRYVRAEMVARYQAELFSMFRLGVSPMGAACHLTLIHNNK